MGAIYRITHKASGTTYVGSTNSAKRRWGEHKSCLRRGVHDNEHLQRAWQKYGETAFEWVVLEDGLADTDLIEHEQSWLDEYRERGEVYNMGDCAEAPMRGRHHTEETKRKMSRVFSEAHRRRLGEAFKGRNHTQETKYKMSKAYARPYPAFIHCETGEIIPAGINLFRLCRGHGLNAGHMNEVKNGKRKSHKGWTLLEKETR